MSETVDEHLIGEHDNFDAPLFEDENIAFYKNAIKLLRKEHPYKTIPYREINEITILNDYLVKNRYFVILINLLLISTCIYLILSNSDNITRSTSWFSLQIVSTLWAPVLVIIVGISSIINCFKRSHIVFFYEGKKKHEYRIKQLSDKKQIPELSDFLRTKTRVNHSLYK